ncbi:MAG TPA: GAF domain-containing protein [Deltaproteobacteria bacterium]|nr:GAF domain-containing protein [Deltaproteobacteria bacterium]HOM30046.1 GAF domain-containing protein [Deltaproteobacteria bacterium]
MEGPYLETLYELVRRLNPSPDITDVFETVVNRLPHVLDTKYCSLFIINPASGELELRAHNHPDIGENPFISVGKQRESIMNLALERGSSLIIKDIEEEIGLPKKDKYETKSFMCILIRRNEEVLGVLNLADKASGGFSREDMLFATIVCELLGAILGPGQALS